MDPFTLATGIAGAITATMTFGGRLYNLWDNFSTAAMEYNVFNQEVIQFAALWQAIEPSIFEPEPCISQELQTILLNIRHGTTRLLKTIKRTVDQFCDDDQRITEAEYQKWVQGSDISGLEAIRSGKARRLRKFLKRSQVRLQREQIESAKTTLLVITNVIQFARSDPSNIGQRTVKVVQALMEEQRTSWLTLRQSDEQVEVQHVEASTWLPCLPIPSHGQTPNRDRVCQWKTPKPITNSQRNNICSPTKARRVQRIDSVIENQEIKHTMVQNPVVTESNSYEDERLPTVENLKEGLQTIERSRSETEQLQQRTLKNVCTNEREKRVLGQQPLVAQYLHDKHVWREHTLQKRNEELHRRLTKLEATNAACVNEYRQLEEETDALRQQHDLFTRSLSCLFEDTERLYNLKAFWETEHDGIREQNKELAARLDGARRKATRQAWAQRIHNNQTRNTRQRLRQEHLLRLELEAALRQTVIENEELGQLQNVCEFEWHMSMKGERFVGEVVCP